MTFTLFCYARLFKIIARHLISLNNLFAEVDTQLNQTVVIGWTMFVAMDMRQISGIAGTEALEVIIARLTKKQELYAAM